MATDINKLITEAERKIASVLAEIESDTGMVLDTLEIKDIEVTQFTDDRPQWLRSVYIEMKRLPGTRWDK